MLRRLSGAIAAALLAFTAAKVNAATTTCNTVAACVMGTNTASGYGVEGKSKSGTGVFGITTYNATSASAGKRGVEGYDQSTSTKGYNVGVYGLSTYGTGMRGDSSQGIGVIGTSLGNAGVSGTSNVSNGVVGITNSTIANVAGVFGSAPYNVEEESAIGVLGETYNGIGVQAITDTLNSDGIALQAVVPEPNGTLFEGVANNRVVASIAGSGDMNITGTLTQKGSPAFRTSGANGSSVTTFGDRISQPTLEDLGEAQLVNGKADVALDARFGASVDGRAKYLVFLTPMGDTRGLYVSERTARGFTVREVGGGRATLVFDYRIAAKPYDSAALRFPSTPALPQLRRNVATALRPDMRHIR